MNMRVPWSWSDLWFFCSKTVTIVSIVWLKSAVNNKKRSNWSEPTVTLRWLPGHKSFFSHTANLARKKLGPLVLTVHTAGQFSPIKWHSNQLMFFCRNDFWKNQLCQFDDNHEMTKTIFATYNFWSWKIVSWSLITENAERRKNLTLGFWH